MPPMPSTVQGGQMRGPSTFDKWKMGAMMGGTVGTIMGFIYGMVSIVTYGVPSAGIMRTLTKYMIGSGTTFGFFMSIGSIIRTDGSSEVAEAFRRARYPPFITPRRQLAPERRET